jgi:hypothetical protein
VDEAKAGGEEERAGRAPNIEPIFFVATCMPPKITPYFGSPP